jgi:thymidylate synthase (FAD)
MHKGHKIDILDNGYVKFIDSMGSDEDFIEAARMSTGKGFHGWYWEEDSYATHVCIHCLTQYLPEELVYVSLTSTACTNCWSSDIWLIEETEEKPKLKGKKGDRRDLGLLEFLYMNKHMTPFEMGELCVEVKAPIMVFREWHRHRTQSYNEFSARYSQMPNDHYVPDPSRIRRQSSANKQGSDTEAVQHAHAFADLLRGEQNAIYDNYETLLNSGVAKEVARINTPVSRYSKMRAKTDVRNWLSFLLLRMPPNAQWEIRQYANAIACIIREKWPRTFALFAEHDLLSVTFSRREMAIIRTLLDRVSVPQGDLTDKEMRTLMKKLSENKEDHYRDIPALQGIL